MKKIDPAVWADYRKRCRAVGYKEFRSWRRIMYWLARYQ